MKLNLKIICCIIAICFFASCKKSKSPVINDNTKYSFKNTEWIGTFHSISQQYDAPCSMLFREDTAVTVYGLFTYVVDLSTMKYIWLDSINGTITKVDTITTAGTTVIDIYFSLTGQKEEFYIPDKMNLLSRTDLTNLPYNYFIHTMGLCPDKIPSVQGTSWSGALQSNLDTYKSYDYPDLSSVQFGTDYVEFVRNGHIITYTDPAEQRKYFYHQIGARIYFAGYDEVYNKIYPYFGVLAPDGKSMLVDARPIDQSVFGYGTPRLPNYLQTNDTYGLPGVTPYIIKQ